MDYFTAIQDWIFDLIFPMRCLGCGKISKHKNEGYLCTHCLTNIPIKQSSECIGCKRTAPLGKTCFICIKENHIDQLFIVTNYDNQLVAKLLTFFKYRFISDLHKSLHQLTARYIKQLHRRKGFSMFASNPLIIPVPLHWRRKNWRGFNQSELIAQNIAHHFQLEHKVNVLRKIRYSSSQVKIADRDQRLLNVQNTFSCINSTPIKDRTIILVDDICTTGATLNECARVLKKQGTAKVIGLVIARGSKI